MVYFKTKYWDIQSKLSWQDFVEAGLMKITFIEPIAVEAINARWLIHYRRTSDESEETICPNSSLSPSSYLPSKTTRSGRKLRSLNPVSCLFPCSMEIPPCTWCETVGNSRAQETMTVLQLYLFNFNQCKRNYSMRKTIRYLRACRRWMSVIISIVAMTTLDLIPAKSVTTQ